MKLKHILSTLFVVISAPAFAHPGGDAGFGMGHSGTAPSSFAQGNAYAYHGTKEGKAYAYHGTHHGKGFTHNRAHGDHGSDLHSKGKGHM